MSWYKKRKGDNGKFKTSAAVAFAVLCTSPEDKSLHCHTPESKPKPVRRKQGNLLLLSVEVVQAIAE